MTRVVLKSERERDTRKKRDDAEQMQWNAKGGRGIGKKKVW